jgi:hypothetical protein
MVLKKQFRYKGVYTEMITQNKSLDQFLCDFFTKEQYVEINAIFLQDKLRNLIQNERLAQAQLLDYKLKYERAMFKVEMMSAEKVINEMNSDVVYRINTKV